MQKKIGDVIYEVKPITPGLSPYNLLLAELLSTPPGTAEEAAKNEVEIDKAMNRLMAGCVSPEPKPEHVWQLYNEIQEVSKAVLREAGLFRGDEGSSSFASRTVVRGSGKEAKRDPGLS